jgi:anti-sigma regulatory factor (Ser/Thr protein kinase)
MTRLVGYDVEFVRRSWPAHPRQLALIRAETRGWLGHLDLSDEVREDVVLAVNEAASNAMEHAYARTSDGEAVEITFWTEENAVCVEIVDHGLWRPPDATPNGRGRGIAIMNQLMQTVLIHYDARGTRVLLRCAA